MITSRRNETLKAIRRLRRRQGDAALLEGPHLVEEALAAGLELPTVLATPEFAERSASAELLARLSSSPLVVEAALLEELADADSPRGILAVARLPRESGALVLTPGPGVVLLVDGVQEPGNLGAIARAAEAFGVRALALTHGCVHPNHPRALRASAGSLLRLVAVREVTAEGLQSRLAPSRARWIGLAAHGGRPLPASFDRDAVVLCCGAEGTGLSAEVECQLDERWTIPLDGRAESLNVAVAVGIALYAMRSASRRATP